MEKGGRTIQAPADDNERMTPRNGGGQGKRVPWAWQTGIERVSPTGAEAPAGGEGEEILTHWPLVGPCVLTRVTLTGSLKGHATGVVTELADLLHIFRGEEIGLRQGSELIKFGIDGLSSFAGFLDEGGNDALYGCLCQIPLTGELKHGETVFFGNGADLFHLLVSVFNPTCGAEAAVVAIPELVTGFHVIVEETAVVHNTGDEIDSVSLGGWKHVLTGPGLKGIQNDHGPVNERTEFFKAFNHVQGETVGGSWCDTESVCKSAFLELGHGIPDGLTGVADAVGVVKHQAIKLGNATACEGLLGSHLEVVQIALGSSEAGLGEASIALGTRAHAAVEVVSDDADEGVTVPVDAFQGLTENLVGSAHAINISCDEGADTFVIGLTHHAHVTLIIERFSKVHVFSAAPGAVCCSREVHVVKYFWGLNAYAWRLCFQWGMREMSLGDKGMTTSAKQVEVVPVGVQV